MEHTADRYRCWVQNIIKANKMNIELKNKLQKVYALVEQGATEGERQAARKQLDRIMKRYNLTESQLQSLDKEYYHFTYTSNNEIRLLEQIAYVLAGLDLKWYRYAERKRMVAQMTYMDNINITCAYEYFRRHMKSEWNKACANIVKRCRTTKTRNEKRALLQVAFISEYLVASKLYKQHQLSERDAKSQKERDALKSVRGVQGGKYNKQMTNGLLLD
ncbi:DUF2786 domain-containing protein [Sphingobacterium multivorum]|uniref:DUF2786 domain-containing protein n=2 Tax=Sphingobacteriaceae TaxID=84566 RepID=UPI003DA61143